MGRVEARSRPLWRFRLALSKFFWSASAGRATPPGTHDTRARGCRFVRPLAVSFFHPSRFPSRREIPVLRVSLMYRRELLLSNDDTPAIKRILVRTFLLDPRIIMSLSSLGIIYRDGKGEAVNLSTAVFVFCAACREISTRHVFNRLLVYCESKRRDRNFCVSVIFNPSKIYKNYYITTFQIHKFFSTIFIFFLYS